MGTYNKADCVMPSETGFGAPQGAFNASPGYRAEKLPAIPHEQVNEIIAPLLAHISGVVCSTDEKAQYFLAFLAQHVQHPAYTTGVALVLTGDQGVGKKIILSWYIQYLLGTDAGMLTGKVSHILGGNRGDSTALQNKVLCVLDEANFATLKPYYVDLLKDVITGETLAFNPKNKAAYKMPNVVNLVFTTHTKNPFVLEVPDSRFVVFDCNGSKKGDYAYFENLAANLNDKTARAFYQFLLNFDLKDYGCFKAKRPDTRA